MNYLKKIQELKATQLLLVSFLEDPGKDGLTMPQKIKLCGEITAMQIKIARIERLPMIAAKKEVYEWPMQITSGMVKPQKEKKSLIKIDRTWHFPLR